MAVLCTQHGVRVCFISVGDFSVRRNGRNYLVWGVPLACGCGRAFGTWVQLAGGRRADARLWQGVVDSRLRIALPKEDIGPRGADAGGQYMMMWQVVIVWSWLSLVLPELGPWAAAMRRSKKTLLSSLDCWYPAGTLLVQVRYIVYPEIIRGD